MKHQIQPQRIHRDLNEMAEIGRTAEGAISRPAFSTAHGQALLWLQAKLDEFSIPWRMDGVGNLIATVARPENSSHAPVATGSHLDSVPDGGNLDGALGVIAGLECLRCAQESQNSLARPLQLISFNDEEGFYGAMLGSSVFSGAISREELSSAVSAEGESLEAACTRCGLPFHELDSALAPPGALAAFVELHIEQGPVLERENVPVGIVSHVAGITRLQVELMGVAGHSGTTPMAGRKDALRCFSYIVPTLDECIQSQSFSECLYTIGAIEAWPGAANVIPGRVRFSLEIRGRDPLRMEELRLRMTEAISVVSQAHGITALFHPGEQVTPQTLDTGIQATIKKVCAAHSIPHLTLPSGASHDAQNMARITPTGMIFVPSNGGISHAQEESTDPDDIAIGCSVLYNTLLELAHE